MSTINKAKKIILVTGDVTIDWNIAVKQNAEMGGLLWNSVDCTRACWQRGGAALLGDLIEELAGQDHGKNNTSCEVRKIENFDQLLSPAERKFHHSYAQWKPHEYEKNDKKKENPAWRVSEFSGLDKGDNGWIDTIRESVKDLNQAEIIVLDDADLGFRDHPKLWQSLSKKENKQNPWIVLKMSRPIASGKLWKFLHKNWAERLIVVMNVEDLRRTEVQISRGLSWERTAQDLVWELIHNPRINALADCAQVVVSFETAGALILKEKKAQLIFDPQGIEAMWPLTYPGGMIGYNSCLTAGIVRQLVLSASKPDIHSGIQSGLNAMRKLHQEGYGDRSQEEPDIQLAFPIKVVTAELLKNEKPFTEVPVQDPTGDSHGAVKEDSASYWTILDDQNKETLEFLAQKIVLEGLDASLENVPIAKFGDLSTVDRREIESFRSIRCLVEEYCSKSRQKRPLSIAVFGAPGSGKSFGIKEIAKTLFPDLIKEIEFNLSQLEDIEALHDAFHQVRDIALSGKIPLVFFDEFDTALGSQRLGWLRHFLAPMQDGSFQQGQITHPIGQAIFVFAGGTCESMEDFSHHDEDKGEFKSVKGPDFISRLKGFINVVGPNPLKANAVTDPYFIIRRAILLRSMFERFQKHLISKSNKQKIVNIDPGVLSAFLHISKYEHGARSMETIFDMSQLSGKKRFERSCLPTEVQLNLHVNGKEFQSMVQKIALTPEILEKLAEAAHDIYCEGKFREGYWPGEEKSEENMTHPWLIPYDELPDLAKEANRVNVRTIPQKLEAIGCIMIPARSNQQPHKFSKEDIDTMAKLEHQLWMDAKFASGFTVGKSTKKHPRRNEYLVHWDKLTKKIKQIDRNLVIGIPDILARAGYTVQKLKDV